MKVTVKSSEIKLVTKMKPGDTFWLYGLPWMRIKEGPKGGGNNVLNLETYTPEKMSEDCARVVDSILCFDRAPTRDEKLARPKEEEYRPNTGTHEEEE